MHYAVKGLGEGVGMGGQALYYDKLNSTFFCIKLKKKKDETT